MIMTMFGFWFRRSVAQAIAPLMRLTGFRFSWKYRVFYPWRIVRWFVDPTHANRLCGTFGKPPIDGNYDQPC